jgi:hypothetical protein
VGAPAGGKRLPGRYGQLRLKSSCAYSGFWSADLKKRGDTTRTGSRQMRALDVTYAHSLSWPAGTPLIIRKLVRRGCAYVWYLGPAAISMFKVSRFIQGSQEIKAPGALYLLIPSEGR